MILQREFKKWNPDIQVTMKLVLKGLKTPNFNPPPQKKKVLWLDCNYRKEYYDAWSQIFTQFLFTKTLKEPSSMSRKIRSLSNIRDYMWILCCNKAFILNTHVLHFHIHQILTKINICKGIYIHKVIFIVFYNWDF